MRKIKFKAKVKRELDKLPTLVEKQQWVLDYTLAYFNTSNRNKTTTRLQGSSCKYVAFPNSEGCAVGRLLTHKSCETLDGIGSVTSVIYEFTSLYSEVGMLPIEFVDMEEFLQDLQTLHDEDNNWDLDTPKGGLSDVGKEFVNEIKVKFKLK